MWRRPSFCSQLGTCICSLNLTQVVPCPAHVSGPDPGQTGSRVRPAGRRWAQALALIKRSWKSIFFLGFGNIVQAKQHTEAWVWATGAPISAPGPKLAVRRCLFASPPLGRDLPLNSGFGEVWSESGLELGWKTTVFWSVQKVWENVVKSFMRIPGENTCRGTRHTAGTQ